MSFQDETRYYETIISLESLSQHHIDSFIYHLNCLHGRPGEAVSMIPPAIIQGLLYRFEGISTGNPVSLMIPVYYNMLISLLLLFSLYKLAVLILKDKDHALLVVIFFKLLSSSNIYLRHILPYDKSLLCFILIIYYYLKNQESNGRILYLNLGILCGLAIVIYPGYYFIPAFLGILVFFRDIISDNNFKKFVLHGIITLAGFLIVIASFEFISRFGGQSYLLSGYSLSDSVVQGTFEESLLFPLKYLVAVEGIPGLIILISVIAILYVFMRKMAAEKNGDLLSANPIYPLLLITLSGILLHGIMGTVFHKMVFYGRLIHLYLPVLCICLVYSCTLIQNKKTRTALLSSALLVFLIHFIIFSITYSRIGYPKDMLYALGIDNKNFSDSKFYFESDSILYKVISPNPLNKLSNEPYTRDSNYLLVNCCYYYPVKDPHDFKPFIPSANLTCIEKKPYYLTFPAYAFEGFSVEERENLFKRKYEVQIYKTR